MCVLQSVSGRGSVISECMRREGDNVSVRREGDNVSV